MLEIIERVNSGGMVLSQSDLLFSSLKLKLHDMERKFAEKLALLNEGAWHDFNTECHVASFKSSGLLASHGSGNSKSSNTTRQAANGRRAHNKCCVEGCPCRMDFSRAEYLLTAAIGNSISARHLHSFGIIILPQFDVLLLIFGDSFIRWRCESSHISV